MGNYKFDAGYLYNDSFTEKDFKKAVIKHIFDDIKSPSYIFDEMILGDVSKIYVPLILSSGEANIEYSRILGYDKIETTTKYKTTTYGSGYQNKTHSTSARSITEWEPDSGIITGSATSGIYDDKYKIYDDYITNHKMDKNNITKLSNDELNKYSLTSENVEYLKNDILNKVFKENITYPANHVKDEEYHGDVNLYDTTITFVSLYFVEISIRDQKLQFVSSSNGEIEIISFGEYPIDNYDEMFKFNKEINAKRLEATKKPRLISKLTILSTILLFALLLILGLSLNVLALTITSIVILIVGIIITIIFMNKVKNISKPYYKQIQEHNQILLNKNSNIKQEGYQNYIKKMNS